MRLFSFFHLPSFLWLLGSRNGGRLPLPTETGRATIRQSTWSTTHGGLFRLRRRPPRWKLPRAHARTPRHHGLRRTAAAANPGPGARKGRDRQPILAAHVRPTAVGCRGPTGYRPPPSGQANCLVLRRGTLSGIAPDDRRPAALEAGRC